jgi:hypothetical protein
VGWRTPPQQCYPPGTCRCAQFKLPPARTCVPEEIVDTRSVPGAFVSTGPDSAAANVDCRYPLVSCLVCLCSKPQKHQTLLPVQGGNICRTAVRKEQAICGDEVAITHTLSDSRDAWGAGRSQVVYTLSNRLFPDVVLFCMSRLVSVKWFKPLMWRSWAPR